MGRIMMMQNITNIMSTQYHLSQIGSMSGKISVWLMEKKIQFCQNFTVVCFRKAEVAYILLWIFMLVAWSSILIGNLTILKSHHLEISSIIQDWFLPSELIDIIVKIVGARLYAGEFSYLQDIQFLSFIPFQVLTQGILT